MIRSVIVGRNIVNISDVKFELLRSGGCGKFSAVISSDSDKPTKGDVFRVYQDGDILYTGTVENIQGTKETGFQIGGNNTTLYDSYIEDGLVIPSLTERQSWLMIKSLLGNQGLSIYDISSPELVLSPTKMISEVSVGGKTVFEALDEFALKSETPLAWGVDGRNRLYAYPIDEALNGLQHFALKSAKRYTYQLNSMLDHGSVYLSSTVEQRYSPLHDNAALQNLVAHPSEVQFNELNSFSSDQIGGIYSDSLGSGESGTPKFTLNNGASITVLPGGKSAYDLDHVGEYIELANVFRFFALKTGTRYCLRYLVAGEIDTLISPAQINVLVTWTGIVGAIQQVVSVSGMAFEEKRFYFTAPAGADGATIRFQKAGGASGDNYGANIREIRLFRDDRAYPLNWNIVIPTGAAGTSQVIDYGIIEGSNFFISNQLPMLENSTDWIAFRRVASDEIQPGILMKWILAVKGVVSVAWPKMQIIVEFFKSDNSALTPYTSPIINILPPSSFATISNSFAVPSDAATAIMSLRFLTMGGCVIGGLVARDAKETSLVFYGDTLQVQRGFGPGRQVRIEGEARDIAEADAYIDAWRKTQTSQIESPQIVVEIPDSPFSFEQPLRIIEDSVKHPIESVEYDLSNMECSLALTSREKTLEDIIARNKKTASGL